MRKPITIITLIIFSLMGNKLLLAQDTLAINGIFSSYSSFAQNRPVTDIKVSLQHPEHESKTWLDAYKFKLSNTDNFKKRELANIFNFCWGLSDGKYVYISSRSYSSHNHSAVKNLGQNLAYTYFSKILYLGNNISYFQGVRILSEKTSGWVGGIVGQLPVSEYYALDMKKGTIHSLNGDGLEDLLISSPELHQEFKSNEHALNHNEKLQYLERLDKLIE